MDIFLNVLINTIINNYFQNSRCIFILSDNPEIFSYRANLPLVNLNVINSSVDEKLIFKHYGCRGIIIQHEDFSEVLTDVEDKFKYHKERFNFRKYLIIPSSHSFRNLTEIFSLPALQYIIDILAIIPEKVSTERASKFEVLCEANHTVKLMTHKYVGRNGNEPEVLDVWFSTNNSFLKGNYLYPDKISNQQGRILRCGTFNYKPYSIIEYEMTCCLNQFVDDSPPTVIGSENALVHEYSKRHNMTIEYVVDDDAWGIIYENWTGNGLLGNLATDKVDIGYAALYSWEHEYKYLDFSKPMIRTGVTCLVPAPRLAGGWLTPFFPFTLEMWIGFGISFIVASFVTAIIIAFLSKLKQMQLNKQIPKLNYKEIYVQSFGRIFRIFLVQDVQTTDNDADLSLRYMFIVFLFSLLMTSSYSSGLASVMTLPRYEGAINTVWELAKSDIHWGATENAWLFSIIDEKSPQYVTIRNKFITASAEDLIELAKTNKFGFSIERLSSGQYAIGNYVTEDIVRNLRLMHDDLYWEYCIFMLRKSSPLLESVDNMVLRLNEAGIINFWQMKAALTHMDVRVQNIVKYYSTNQEEGIDETVKLQWHHVEGAFAILTAGYVISVTSFVLEILIYKYQHKSQIFLDSE